MARERLEAAPERSALVWMDSISRLVDLRLVRTYCIAWSWVNICMLDGRHGWDLHKVLDTSRSGKDCAILLSWMVYQILIVDLAI